MKIFTSFLLAFLLVSSINSFPNEYTDTGNAEANVLENGGGEQGTENTSLSIATIPSYITTEETKIESENEELKITTEESSTTDTSEQSTTRTEPTTSIETTTSIPSTTSAFIPHISYDVEDLIESVSSRFKELRIKFLNDQHDVYNKAKLDLEMRKTLFDTSMQKSKQVYDQKIALINNHLKILETKKSEIEKTIERIDGTSWEVHANIKELDKLKERQKKLTGSKSEDIENKIAELEEKSQMHKNKIRRLNHEETHHLIMKYGELIHILHKEVKERKKKETLEDNYHIVNEQWKGYTEYIGDFYAKVEDKMNKLTVNSLKISHLKSYDTITSDDEDDADVDWDLYNNYKWIPINANTSIPSGAVLGGKDADGSNLYIIRTKKDDSYLYGKYVVGSNKKEAYVTKGRKEISVNIFELLTSRKYTWCDSETYQIPDSYPPICRAIHIYRDSTYDEYELTIPGTLLEDGRCRIGFGLEAHTYTRNVEVLAFESCSISEVKINYKSWF